MRTLPQIREAIDTAFTEVERYFSSLPEEALNRRSAGGWAPLHDLEHVSLTTGLTARSLSSTDAELEARWGRASRPSRTYDEVRGHYLEVLREGFRSPERFVPRSVTGAAGKDARATALAQWNGAGDALRRALDGWDEARLDRFFIPHPALGDLTARELLFFTHLHALHHVEVAKRRVASAAP